MEALNDKLKEFLPENPGEAPSGGSSSTKVADNYMGSFKAGERVGSVNSNSSNMYDLPHPSEFTIETLHENKYRSKLKQMRDMLEKFTREWNADEKNRD